MFIKKTLTLLICNHLLVLGACTVRLIFLILSRAPVKRGLSITRAGTPLGPIVRARWILVLPRPVGKSKIIMGHGNRCAHSTRCLCLDTKAICCNSSCLFFFDGPSFHPLAARYKSKQEAAVQTQRLMLKKAKDFELRGKSMLAFSTAALSPACSHPHST